MTPRPGDDNDNGDDDDAMPGMGLSGGDAPDDDLEDTPEQVILLVPRFVARLKRMRWFSTVGQPHDRALKTQAAEFLDALGFPDIGLAAIGDWREAEDAAESVGVDTAAFDAEEQLRASLEADALEAIGEDASSVALSHIHSVVGIAAREGAMTSARIWGLGDLAVIDAAVGAAVVAAHEAALILLSGRGDENHPFALKFALFERGRWPVGVTGSSFNLF